MLTMKQWMDAVNYRITEGSEYGWSCYGDHAYNLDSWDGDQDGVSSSIILDTVTQAVYEISVCDYSKNRAYRLINPDFRSAHDKEARNRNISIDEAWDDIKYTDLETDEDMLSKLNAIMNYEEYDERVSVPVDFTDEELLTYMKIAHERDITFNQLVTEAIKAAVEDHERDPEGFKNRAEQWKSTRARKQDNFYKDLIKTDIL